MSVHLQLPRSRRFSVKVPQPVIYITFLFFLLKSSIVAISHGFSEVSDGSKHTQFPSSKLKSFSHIVYHCYSLFRWYKTNLGPLVARISSKNGCTFFLYTINLSCFGLHFLANVSYSFIFFLKRMLLLNFLSILLPGLFPLSSGLFPLLL